MVALTQQQFTINFLGKNLQVDSQLGVFCRCLSYYVLGLPGAFTSRGSKNLKKLLEKNFLFFRKWNFLALILKVFLCFLERKLVFYFEKWNPALFSQSSKNKIKNLRQENFLYFRKRKPPKSFLWFLQKRFCYISGKWNFYISGYRMF